MKIAIVLYDDFTALDAVGPYEVLGQLPGVDLRFVAEHARPYVADTGRLALVVDHTFDEVPSPDIVVVPGGPGSRRARENPALLDWVRRVHATTTWTTSVCTGAEVLAAAGLLAGQPCTTHWARYEVVEALGATPCAERVVRSDRVITCAGVSAGIDMALWLVRWQLGDLPGEAIQLALEYDPSPPIPFGDISPAARQLVLAAFAAREAAET